MSPFYFPNISNQNILHVLKKCNDESFIKFLRTCSRICDISKKMEKKTRIFCHAHLVAFVYFDESDGKVMFDVPYRLNKILSETNSKQKLFGESCTHLLVEEMDDEEEVDEIDVESEESESSTEDELMDDDPLTKLKQEEDYVMNDRHQFSHLILRRSDRESSHYRKMTAEDFCRLVEFFRFETITIDPNREEFEVPHPKRFDVAEEILKMLPFLRAETLKLDLFGSEDIFYRTLNLSHQSFNFKKLLIHNSEEYGIIEKLQFDWQSLEAVEAQCYEANAQRIYQDVINKWRFGETNLKHLKLEIVDAIHFPRGLNRLNTFLQINNGYHNVNYYYIEANYDNRQHFAIIYWVYNVINFYDISDCDGCDCQTEFCFKKMLEIITDNWDVREVIDWGTIVDTWDNGTIRGLGIIVEQKICECIL